MSPLPNRNKIKDKKHREIPTLWGCFLWNKDSTHSACSIGKICMY